MSAPHDVVFCGHCGDRLPAFGAALGYCAPCARVLRVRVTREPAGSAAHGPPARPSPAAGFVKDPLLAGVLSTVFPGSGQFYNAQFLKAVLVFATSPLVIPWFIGIVDAFFSARRINARAELEGLVRPA